MNPMISQSLKKPPSAFYFKTFQAQATIGS